MTKSIAVLLLVGLLGGCASGPDPNQTAAKFNALLTEHLAMSEKLAERAYNDCMKYAPESEYGVALVAKCNAASDAVWARGERERAQMIEQFNGAGRPQIAPLTPVIILNR